MSTNLTNQELAAAIGQTIAHMGSHALAIAAFGRSAIVDVAHQTLLDHLRELTAEQARRATWPLPPTTGMEVLAAAAEAADSAAKPSMTAVAPALYALEQHVQSIERNTRDTQTTRVNQRSIMLALSGMRRLIDHLRKALTP